MGTNKPNEQSNGQPRVSRCAVYCRKSVADAERKEWGSIEAQRQCCENFIRSHALEGWTILEKNYDDYGWSGKNLERPAFKELMRDCAAGLVDRIVTYRIDRLSRSPRDFEDFNEEMKRFGVKYVSVSESFLDNSTAMGRMMISVILSFAACERETSQERVQKFFDEKRELGGFLGGRTPYGYISQKCKLYPHPDQAPHVEHIFKLYIETGGSSKRVATTLNAEGLPRSDGGAWNPRAVYNLIRCPRYAGLAYNKARELITGEQDALISRELWDRAQRIVGDLCTGEAKRAPTPESAYLKGLLKCGHCGGAISYRATSHRTLKGGEESGTQRRRYAYYYCTTDQRRSVSLCPVRSIAAGAFESFLEEQVEKVLAASSEFASRIATRIDLSPAVMLDALKKKGRVYDVMDLCQRRELMHIALVGVKVFERRLELEINNEALGILADEFAFHPDANDGRSLSDATGANTQVTLREGNLVLVIGSKFNFVSGRRKIVEETTDKPTVTPLQLAKRKWASDPMLQSVARAFAWLRMFDDGSVETVYELSKKFGLDKSNVRQTLRLAALSPRIIRAILNGTAPSGLTLKRLKSIETTDWAEQELQLGFSA